MTCGNISDSDIRTLRTHPPKDEPTVGVTRIDITDAADLEACARCGHRRLEHDGAGVRHPCRKWSCTCRSYTPDPKDTP